VRQVPGSGSAPALRWLVWLVTGGQAAAPPGIWQDGDVRAAVLRWTAWVGRALRIGLDGMRAVSPPQGRVPLLLACATTAWLGGASPAPAEPAAHPGWLERSGLLERSSLTGSWGGWREKLAERGVFPGARYTTGFWSNLRGGFETGIRYEGFAEWWVALDLEELARWKGGSFEINWYSYHGGQPSDELVGLFATQTVSGHETARSVRFYEILLRQTWAEGRFVVEIGQLAADTDFFLVENADSLINGTFGFLGLGRQSAVAPFYPLAAPGVYFQASTPQGHWSARVGVYVAGPGVDESSNFGFGYRFGDGVVLLGELQARRSPFGLPGVYALGVIGTTAEVADYEKGGTVEGGVGLFASIDQTLLEHRPDRPGLGAFARSYGAPHEDRSQIHWYLDFGLKLTRPLPGRPRDVLSLGFAYLNFSDDYVASLRAGGENVSRQESVLELTYRVQMTPWLRIQPDLQFVFDPQRSRRDAIVFGLRAVIEL